VFELSFEIHPVHELTLHKFWDSLNNFSLLFLFQEKKEEEDEYNYEEDFEV
jgi:hypothetical protein